MHINIVLNYDKNEYWIAEPHYNEQIERRIETLRKLYGSDKIHAYLSDYKNIQQDAKFEEDRGFRKSHYSNWLETSVGKVYGGDNE